MILVADSGSTKTDWGLMSSDGAVRHFQTIGINPYFYGSKQIYETLTVEIPNDLKCNDISRIYFYGAGCSSEQRIKRVRIALKKIFPNAAVMVDHDLLGAARALCGKERGIATIMGTGSNACLFDGEKIVDQHGGIGYILGDEASGAWLGKQLIQRVFYNELPGEIQASFDAKYGTDKNELINGIYKGKYPNRYLASFALFYRDWESHPYMVNIISQSFEEFVVRHILRFGGYTEVPFNALGSIAYYFQNILSEVLQEHNIRKGLIIRKPIDSLLNFHK